MADDIFDFVVVGSGAGGGPVAANLALAGYSVLVLEAGGDSSGYNYRIPCFHPFASEDPSMSWDFFVRHYSDQAMQQKDTKFVAEQNGIFYPRAGTLGGCTAHNAMITVYPQNSDWEYLQTLTGDSSWSPENMRRYFERIEHCDYVSSFHRLKEAILGMLLGKGSNPSRHGFSGWLHTQIANPKMVFKDEELLKLVTLAAVKGLAHHIDNVGLALETLFDPNDWRAVTSTSREGVVLTPLATRSGCRNSTRERLLDAAGRSQGRLKIQLNALASRVVFEGTRAVGVEYLAGKGLYRASREGAESDRPETKFVRARLEVILSGGAFNSPQLLMLSGIGNENELRDLNIGVVKHLPGVGQNLQDRYEVGIVSQMEKPFALLHGASFNAPVDGAQGDEAFQAWKKGTGVYTSNGAAIAITKRSTPDKPDPDLFIFGLPSSFEGYVPGYSNALRQYQDRFTWAVLKAHTRNTAGYVKLRSADPRDVPEINFRYFREGNDAKQEDLQAVVKGVQFVREINEEIRKLVGITEVWPGTAIDSEQQIAEFIQHEAWGHHASCTNKIGPASDSMAVLDHRFRVHGIQGLRVVDASVFSRIPGYFIVSAVYMIAEKASDVILEDAKANQPSEGVSR